MAEAVVSFAVERLGDLLISEATYLSGVKHKVLEIQRQLREMQHFLKDAENKRGNPEVGRWVAEIRELALQTEDVLETYAVKVASRTEEGGRIKEIMRRFACIIGECTTLHKIGSEIDTIRATFTELASGRRPQGIQVLPDYQAESSKAAEERQLGRISYGRLINENDFVGMEEEIQKLVLHLKKEDRGYEVVSVWGMGGQGKTTLVQKVYHHDDVRSHFQAFAWVCITQNFEKRKVLEDIVQGLLPTKNDDNRRMGDTELVNLKNDDIRKMGDIALVRLLHRTQEEFKCLIVIDDIWDVGHWKILEQFFLTSSTKILLTTRNKAVADVGFPYELRSLTMEEGWKLLLKKAFPRDDEIIVEPKKEKLGKDMVQQCQGLPLAFSVLGGILKNKNSLREWEMVKEDIGSYLSRGEGIEDSGVKYILSLSYDDLPFRLKQLFLFLGTFKEDEEIKSEKLYLLWIAEGMIPSVQKAKGEMLMDVAERYLVELAQRSLIQLNLMDESLQFYSSVPWVKVQSCHLHDLIRDLCLSKGKEEEFLKKIDFRDAHNKSDHSVIGIGIRRLAINMYNVADNLDNIALEQQHFVGQLRSLLFFSSYWIPNKINNLKDFKMVRVLKLENLEFTKREFSRGIIELIHLRYLSLTKCKLEELPSCIGDLRYLESLDLKSTMNVIIPDVLWKMKRLKHLYLPLDFENVNKKLRFDGLNELELLWNIEARKCDANDLMKLTNLHVLKAMIYTLQELEGVMNFVNSELHHTRYTSLELRRDYYDLIQLLQCENLNELTIIGNMRGNYMTPQPQYEQLRPSQSLTCIDLHYCDIGAKEMVLLEKLPNLQMLCFICNSFVENEFVCTANSFPQLRLLKLWEEKLEKWRVDEGALPNLSVLRIWDCKKLEMLPEGMKFLKSLGQLYIRFMPKAFNDRVRVMDGVEGQDFYKVRHIPNIYIEDEKD